MMSPRPDRRETTTGRPGDGDGLPDALAEEQDPTREEDSQ
jgi:hypothetical protein